MIKSVDGKEDTKSIVNFVNNKFLSRDTRAFRNHLLELQPDMEMVFEYDNPNTGEKESILSLWGLGFLPFRITILQFYTIKYLKCVTMEMVSHFGMYIKCLFI